MPRKKQALPAAPTTIPTPAAPPAPANTPPPEPISNSLGVQRVRNGFLVEVSTGVDSSFRERPKFVARDAYELGELVRRWAQPTPATAPSRKAKPATA